MQQYQTQDGPRPDLAALEVNMPTGYVGSVFYPTLKAHIESSKFRYTTLTADSAAQEDLADGTAPTRVRVGSSEGEYSVNSQTKGYKVARAEVPQWGGIENADRVGGKGAKRSVMNKRETDIITQLLLGSPTDISADFFGGIQTAAKAVKRYGGRLGFGCSDTTYQYIVSLTEVKDKLKEFSTVSQFNAEDVYSRKVQVFKAMLQNIYAFDEIVIWDDAFSPSGKEDYAVIAKLPSAEETSHVEDPILGKVFQYLPDGNEFYLESFYDKDDKDNKYDAYLSYDVVELNAGAKALVNGLQASTA
jgi:hypothetical protein